MNPNKFFLYIHTMKDCCFFASKNISIFQTATAWFSFCLIPLITIFCIFGLVDLFLKTRVCDNNKSTYQSEWQYSRCTMNRCSRPEVFLGKGVLKICNFIKIALRHGCSSVHLLHVLRTLFPKNTSGQLFLNEIFDFYILFIISRNGNILNVSNEP